MLLCKTKFALTLIFILVPCPPSHVSKHTVYILHLAPLPPTDTKPSPDDRVMTIRNEMAYENTDNGRAKTVSSFNSITIDRAPKDSDTRTAFVAENEAARYELTEFSSSSKPDDEAVPAATGTSATADYEEPSPYSSSSTSLAPQTSFV